MKHVLFICSQNRLRSPTAEQVFSGYLGLECASAGLNHDAENPVTPELLEWAEIIFVMEKAHRRHTVDGDEHHVGALRHRRGNGGEGGPRRDLHGGLVAVAVLVDAVVGPVEGARVDRRVAVVASGDPMHYGAGVTLARHFPGEALVLPSISSVTLACARLGWPVGEVEVVTVHGRPLERVLLHVTPGARLLILSQDGDTPKSLSHLLTQHRYGPSTMTVFERLGGHKERRIDDVAECWNIPAVDDLNLIAVTCAALPKTHILPRAAGLPDAAARPGRHSREGRAPRRLASGLAPPRPPGPTEERVRPAPRRLQSTLRWLAAASPPISRRPASPRAAVRPRGAATTARDRPRGPRRFRRGVRWGSRLRPEMTHSRRW